MNISTNTPIKKSSGKFENYSPEKIRKSLLKSGLETTYAEEIEHELAKTLGPNETSTEDIFNKAKEIVFRKSTFAGINYSLKNAIIKLGPGGFVFEKFIAKALETENYYTETNLHLEGVCIKHEIDVRGKKNGYTMLAECKFHHNQDIINDVKVALYVKARMDDLKNNPVNQFNDYYLISNTSFSKDAIKYSQCAGLKLLGFNYPQEKTLYKLIEEGKHFPITCIPWLKKSDIQFLLEQGVILIRELYSRIDLLYQLNCRPSDIEHFKNDYQSYFLKK